VITGKQEEVHCIRKELTEQKVFYVTRRVQESNNKAIQR
jgi:hypothetical protein